MARESETTTGEKPKQDFTDELKKLETGDVTFEPPSTVLIDELKTLSEEWKEREKKHELEGSPASRSRAAAIFVCNYELQEIIDKYE